MTCNAYSIFTLAKELIWSFIVGSTTYCRTLRQTTGGLQPNLKNKQWIRVFQYILYMISMTESKLQLRNEKNKQTQGWCRRYTCVLCKISHTITIKCLTKYSSTTLLLRSLEYIPWYMTEEVIITNSLVVVMQCLPLATFYFGIWKYETGIAVQSILHWFSLFSFFFYFKR